MEVHVSGCHANRASADEPDLSSVALACIAENDLDDWWQELDVELKADVFLTHTLGSGLRIHDCAAIHERLRVPVAGTVNAAPVAQPDGCGAIAPDLAEGTMQDEMHGGAH